MNDDEKVTYFAETDARNQKLKFGIKEKDRTKHMYVIGKTGMGKSTLLENLAIQDIQNGNGLAFLDPHGKTADLLLEYIPKERIDDVIYFAPFDMEYPVSFNVMEDVGAERRHLVSSGLMSAFKKIWVDAWSARMEYILGNIMLALLEYPGSTLIGVNRMLADKNFRNKVVENITDPSVKSFWVDEYAKYTEKFAAEAAPAIQNKVGQFVANPLVRNIIGQPKSTFDIRKIMDEKKILIINLSKGRVGESNANLLGSMLITKIYLAAMSRAELNEKELKAAPQFYLYVDEFQSFANESFADILSEARKYKLNLTIAHQYIEQMSEEVRAAVFGNVGTMATFRVGAYDGEVLEKEFGPQFMATDIVSLQQYQMYLKLMIDGVSSQPFSATGMMPIPKPEISYVKEIIDASRKNFARPRYEVEDEIRRWHEDKFTDAPAGSKSLQGGATSERRGDDRKPVSGSSQSNANSGSSNNGGGNENGSQNKSNGAGVSNHSSQGQNVNTNQPTRIGGSIPTSSANQRTNSNVSQNQGQSQNRNEGSSTSTTQNTGVSKQIDRQLNHSSLRDERPSRDRGSGQGSSSQHNSKKENENREVELRKAISLSYLKTDTEVKNDQKTAKPENIAALRDALLSVMKEAKVDTTSMEAAIKASPTSDQLIKAETLQSPQAVQKTVTQDAQTSVAQKVELRSRTNVDPKVEPKVEFKSKPEVKVEQKVIDENVSEPIKENVSQSQSTQQSTPKDAHSSERKPQQSSFAEAAASQAKTSEYGNSQRSPVEVPEEILKKILNVQE